MCYICFAPGVPAMPLNLNLSWLSYKNHIPPVCFAFWMEGCANLGLLFQKKEEGLLGQAFSCVLSACSVIHLFSFRHLFHYDPPSSAANFCLPVLCFSKRKAEQQVDSVLCVSVA